ncbi:MAG: ParM/StbA family protein [Xenococcus sp. (in: cyanobacteria)]
MNQRASKLTLIFDPGTSLTKALYKSGRKGAVKFLTMDSHLLAVGVERFARFNKTSDFAKPEDNAWLQTDNSACFLVGRLARESRASTSIKLLKYESMVPKILALIGAIALKEKLSRFIKLELSILLPYGEYSNRGDLEQELQKSLGKFKFQGSEYQVELQRSGFFPEGFGIFSSRAQNNSPELIQGETSAILMFGYRNTSLLLFPEGSFSLDGSGSTELGFYNFSDLLIQQASGLTRDAIKSAIYTGVERVINYKTARGEDKSVTKIAVGDLVRVRDPHRADVEKRRLRTAVANASQDYWQLLRDWLDEVLPGQRHLDQLIYTGGTSGFFEEELQGYLSKKYSKIGVGSTDEMEQELLSVLGLSELGLEKFKQEQLPLRFADAWGIFKRFAKFNPASLSVAKV